MKSTTQELKRLHLDRVPPIPLTEALQDFPGVRQHRGHRGEASAQLAQVLEVDSGLEREPFGQGRNANGTRKARRELAVHVEQQHKTHKAGGNFHGGIHAGLLPSQPTIPPLFLLPLEWSPRERAGRTLGRKLK